MNKDGRYHRAGLATARIFFNFFSIPLKLFRLERLYLIVSLAVLFLTTTVWSVLGARINNYNADQIVNAYLFQDTHSFHTAYLPAAHTFLIKWPLMFSIKIFGISSATLILFTLALSLATVAIFAGILALIEKRPVVLGTLYLALASVLMLVPFVPAPGTLLPFNSAMITTRNIEYVYYIGALYLLIRNYSLKDARFWLATLLIALLGASDKLFLYVSLGGGLAALIIYSLRSGWNLVSFSAKWVSATLAGLAGCTLLLWLLDRGRVVHFVAQQLGPYGYTHSLKGLALGLAYALTAIFSNMGANPAFDTTVLKDMPGRLLHNFFIFGAVGFVANCLLLLGGLAASYALLKRSFDHNRNERVALNGGTKLALAMIWSSLAALILFIFTNHYYAADGRYLGIVTFTLFVVFAAYSSAFHWKVHQLMLVGEILILGIMLATPAITRSYRHDIRALQPAKNRNFVVLEALSKHRVDYLVGDYWRVVPAKFTATDQELKIVPLEGCTEPKQALSTEAWRPNLAKHSFAYLLTSAASQTDFPKCTLKDVVGTYGRPNSSVLLAGSFEHPVESLLFYDHGINNSSPVTPAPPQGPSTVVPIDFDQLPSTYCPLPTIMSVVAHQDDDLLFMNPDLAHDIQAGHCIRTIYMTAGDAGRGRFYWLGRLRGSEAAYSKMMGTSGIWVERILKIGDNEYITVANPRGDQKVTLIFMYLPDGNINGQGFTFNKNQSLENLGANKISSISSVYSGSTYSPTQLTNALTALMHFYQPTEIRTQSNYPGFAYPDHSDHRAVGRFTLAAYQTYIQQRFGGRPEVPIKFYLGYSGHEQPPNVAGQDLINKEAVFLEYSKFDAGVCQSDMRCRRDPAYGAYLVREYTNSY